MDLGLTGRRAAVAAASTGLGRACAQALADDGARVALCSHDREKVDRAARDIGQGSVPLVADLATWADGVSFVDEAAAALGGLDLLVVNHPGPPLVRAVDVTESQVRRSLEASLMVSLGMIQAALPGMRTQGFGRVVVISSLSAREPLTGLALSTLARAGLTGFVKTLADEVAADGVTVNTVQPGFHRTDRVTDAVAEEMAQQIPSGRLGEPAGIGATVAFLCSMQASFVTGTSVVVDGGHHRGL
jgi:3-oxoacyl-[acyl-carrier protein] reductase